MNSNFSAMKSLSYYHVGLFSDGEQISPVRSLLLKIREQYLRTRSKQSDSVQISDNFIRYYISYTIEEGKPMKWEVKRDDILVESVKQLEDGKYVVIVFNDDKSIKELIHYSKNHVWLGTDFFKEDSDPLFTLVPKRSEGVCVISKYSSDSKSLPEILYQTSYIKGKNAVLPEAEAYTDKGIVYFVSEAAIEKFKNKSFADGTPKVEEKKENALGLNATHFINKNQGKEIKNIFASAEYLLEAAETQEQQPFIADDANTQENAEDNSSVMIAEKYEAGGFYLSKADKKIISGGNKYFYFGELDENGKRTGRGRTVMQNGLTAYEGEYLNDKRNGFGIYYYKTGTVCYIGGWNENRKHGFGVSFSPDGEPEAAGKWQDGKPAGVSATFDPSGDFLKLYFNQDGNSSDLGIVIDSEKGAASIK